MAPLIADISHWFSRRRGLAVGIAFSGSYVAGAIWPPILQRMFDAQGWRESFIDLALLTLVLMALLSLLLYPKPTTNVQLTTACLLYTSPSPRDATLSRMPSSA